MGHTRSYTREGATAADVIRELRASGMGDEQVAAMLNSTSSGLQLPPPPGAASWTTYMVRAILGESGGRA